MNDTSAALAVLAGLAVRLMIPILVTAVIVLMLTRLDRRWRSEGSVAPLKVEKPECWKARHCSASQRKKCPGYKSDLPCWQAFRHSDGYLDQKCLGCPVLATAPIPAHT
jgi:hypothetical protein